MKMLIVCGVFDEKDGKKSGLMQKVYELLKVDFKNIDLFNGGNYNDIDKLFHSTINYDTILWMPHIDNELPKIRDVKMVNPYCTLIMSKRNDGVYNFQQILNKCITQRANLMIEFSKQNDIFNMRLFDPLGNVWYNGNSVEDFVLAFKNRLLFIKSTHRVPTFKSDKKPEKIELSKTFLKYVNNWSKIFYSIIKPDDEVSRFLGNISLKKNKNEPINDKNNYIIVSERNADKINITENNFVSAYNENGKMFYIGDKKPSRDTAVQYELYKIFKNVNYILHCHTYVKNGVWTKTPIPCGCLEEIGEIVEACHAITQKVSEIKLNKETENNNNKKNNNNEKYKNSVILNANYVNQIDDGSVNTNKNNNEDSNSYDIETFVSKIINQNNVEDFSMPFYQFNLKGHGCLILAKDLKDFDKVEFIERNLPEIM